MKDTNNLINNKNFLMEDPENGYPLTSCMDVCKAKIQCDGSLEKFKLRILVRGDLQNKERIGDTWSPKKSMRTLKYFLSDDSNHKPGLQQLDFIGSFIQANIKHIVFVKLDSRYGEYFPEYANYFRRLLRPKKSIYEMNNYRNLFADEPNNCLINEAGSKKSQYQMYIYYKY